MRCRNLGHYPRPSSGVLSPLPLPALFVWGSEQWSETVPGQRFLSTVYCPNHHSRSDGRGAVTPRLGAAMGGGGGGGEGAGQGERDGDGE
jgi:hypothetical protein